MPLRMHVTGVRDDEPDNFDVELVDRLQERRMKRQDKEFQARLARAIEGKWEQMPVALSANDRPFDVLPARVSPSIVSDHPPYPLEAEKPEERVNPTLGIGVVTRRHVRRIRVWPGDQWHVNVSLPRVSMQEAEFV